MCEWGMCTADPFDPGEWPALVDWAAIDVGIRLEEVPADDSVVPEV